MTFAELLEATATATPDLPVRAMLAGTTGLNTYDLQTVEVEVDNEGRRVAVWLTLA
jgi:hypothetical protein